MSDISFPVLLNLLIFFIFPILGGYIALRLRTSPIIGYIVGGIFLGLFFGGRLPHEFISQFSILGLVLLVFTIGLDTNFGTIRKFGRFVLLGGTIQILMSAVLIGSLSILFGFPLVESFFFGFAFAMSSTAVVSKLIQERGEENSLVGGIAIGILIFQDLAFIPLLIVLSSLSTGSSPTVLLQNIVFNIAKAALVLGLVYYLGIKVVPVIFNRVAKFSREYLNLFIIFFILCSLALFSFLGLSSVLAAFIAGVLVGQTIEHYHIFSQIRPLRDLLAIIFFVFLGMTIQPAFLVAHAIPILVFTTAVIIVKIAVVLVIYILFRFHSRTSFSLSLFLFQVGEAAFILLFAGVENGVMRKESYYFALSIVLLTLIINPFFIAGKDKLYRGIRAFLKTYLPFVESFVSYSIDRDTPNIDVIPLKKHVIICGYGRVGKYIGRALTLAEIPFIAIDYNFHTVEQVKKDGVNIIYGDPTELDVLDYAECEEASVLISAVPERYAQETIVMNAKKLKRDIIVLTRVHRESDQRRLKDLGVDVVVHPEFEASLSIIRKILLLRNVPKDEISSKIQRLKIEHGMA